MYDKTGMRCFDEIIQTTDCELINYDTVIIKMKTVGLADGDVECIVLRSVCSSLRLGKHVIVDRRHALITDYI